MSKLTSAARADLRILAISLFYPVPPFCCRTLAHWKMAMPLLIVKKPADIERQAKAMLMNDDIDFTAASSVGAPAADASGGDCPRCEPQQVLADEPTGNLDLRNADSIPSCWAN